MSGAFLSPLRKSPHVENNTDAVARLLNPSTPTHTFICRLPAHSTAEEVGVINTDNLTSTAHFRFFLWGPEKLPSIRDHEVHNLGFYRSISGTHLAFFGRVDGRK